MSISQNLKTNNVSYDSLQLKTKYVSKEARSNCLLLRQKLEIVQKCQGSEDIPGMSLENLANMFGISELGVKSVYESTVNFMRNPSNSVALKNMMINKGFPDFTKVHAKMDIDDSVKDQEEKDFKQEHEGDFMGYLTKPDEMKKKIFI